MSIEVRFRSGAAAVIGVAAMVAGVVGGSVSSPWWWALVPIGVVQLLRLERNPAWTRLAALKRGGLAVVWGDRRFFAVSGGRIYDGAIVVPHVAALERHAEEPDGEAAEAGSRPPAKAREWRCVRLADVDRIESTTGEKTVRVILPDRVEEFGFRTPPERDAALELLRAARRWSVAEAPRRAFAVNALAWIVCLPFVLFTGAVVLVTLGAIPAACLPLADFADARKVRGKGRVLAVLWAAASQGYLFVADRLPPPAVAALAGLACAAAAALLYASQWTTVTTSTWTPTGQAERSDEAGVEQIAESLGIAKPTRSEPD